MYLAAFFVAVNIALWLAVLAVQGVESRHGRIPPRRKWGSPSPFLYFQDWHTATWGDLVGISLIDWGFGYFAAQTQLNYTFFVSALLIGSVTTTAAYLRFHAARHRPDSGFPKAGTASLHGVAHLSYFFIQSSLAAYLCIAALGGALGGTTLAVALVGGAIYAASFAVDVYSGRFALLPKP